MFDNIDVGGSWEQFKTQVYSMAVDVLGIKKTNHRDWSDENDASITKLLNEKNKLHEKLLSTDGPGKIAAEQVFKELKSRLQCEIRHMKNTEVVERDLGRNLKTLSELMTAKIQSHCTAQPDRF